MDNGRKDASLLAPSKSKGLSIGSDTFPILFLDQSPCHIQTKIFNEIKQSVHIQIKRSWEWRAKNDSICFEAHHDLNLTSFVLETLLCP